MKNRILITGLLLLRISLNVEAQKKTFVDDLAYKNISQFSMNDFINMDFNFLGFLPTIKDYKNPVTRFKKGNTHTFRYIDSLDIKKTGNDSLHITIYTQNYAYASQNTYIIGKDKTNKNKSLLIYNINFNQHLKPIISEEETFRKSDFKLDISEKIIDSETPARRIIFKKTYS